MVESDTGLLPHFRRKRHHVLHGPPRHVNDTHKAEASHAQSNSDGPYTGPPVPSRRANTRTQTVNPTSILLGSYHVSRARDTSTHNPNKRKRGNDNDHMPRHHLHRNRQKKKRRSSVGVPVVVNHRADAVEADREAGGYAADDEEGYASPHATNVLHSSKSLTDLMIQTSSRDGQNEEDPSPRKRSGGGRMRLRQVSRTNAIPLGERGVGYGGVFDKSSSSAVPLGTRRGGYGKAEMTSDGNLLDTKSTTIWEGDDYDDVAEMDESVQHGVDDDIDWEIDWE